MCFPPKKARHANTLRNQYNFESPAQPNDDPVFSFGQSTGLFVTEHCKTENPLSQAIAKAFCLHKSFALFAMSHAMRWIANDPNNIFPVCRMSAPSHTVIGHP